MRAQGEWRDDSPLARALALLTSLLLRAPRAVLWVALASAAFALLLAFGSLRFRTNRLDLLNPDSSYNRRWLAYLDEFGTDDDVVLIFQGSNAGAIAAAIDDTAERLEQLPELFDSVFSRVDGRSLQAKALHYLSPSDLESLREAVERLAPAIAGDWSRLELSALLKAWNDRATDVLRQEGSEQAVSRLLRSAGELERMLAACRSAHGNGPIESASLIGNLIDAPEHPLNQLAGDYHGRLMLDDGRRGLLLVRLRQGADGDATGGSASAQLVHGTRAIARLREVVETQRVAHPGVAIGLTGLPILEYDEMRTSQNDMLLAGAISLVAVACLFIAGFGGVRLPLLTVAALLIAMAWSFGFVTLSVGHLNILSISFGVILIGLGIDFGIHYVARYTQLRAEGLECDRALVRTSAGVGPGIVTGGITTALAFFSASLTQFTGVAELGIVAGGGILLCILAALAIIPVLIRLTERAGPRRCAPRPLPFSMLTVPVVSLPRGFLGLSIVATLVLGAGVWELTVDHNLLRLQAEGLESVDWEHRLLESGDHSVWFAVSMAPTREELTRRKRQFDQLPCVQRTEEIVSLLPSPDAARSAAIAQIRQGLTLLPDDVPLLPVVPRPVLLEQLRRTRRIVDTAPHHLRSLGLVVERMIEQLEQGDWARSADQISRFQQHVVADLLEHLRRLRSVADPESPRAEELPATLVSRFVGRGGQHLLRVYARGNIWDTEALGRFVRQVEQVDGHITGHPIQAFYASRQMQQSYMHAAVYSLLAVAIVLMIDFQQIRFTLLAMLPMACGMLQLLGLLGWLGIPLNPANMIVLPLILGIGIDDGVHIVHDFRRRQGLYRVSRSTAAAIVLTSATTMVGFGSLMLARHQGLRSLGQVLTLGVACCLVTSLVTLPATLAILSRSAPAPGPAAPVPAPGPAPVPAPGPAPGPHLEHPHLEHPRRVSRRVPRDGVPQR